MPIRSYTAWHFQHPDFDAADNEVPGLRISSTGGIELIHEEASIRQSMLLLMSTRPGERVMRPDYGCELHKLIFSPNDETSAGLAIYYVKQALNKWEPRIDILKVDADANPLDPTRLDIMLIYRVRTTQKTDELTFSIEMSL